MPCIEYSATVVPQKKLLEALKRAAEEITSAIGGKAAV
jgi:hypothetical protein